MSFIDDVLDVGKGVVDYLKGDSIGSALARTAALGLAVNQIGKLMNKDTSQPATVTATPNEPDRGVRLQVNPDTQHKIPVVYGSAHLGGIITDAQISNNNSRMTYCVTICEMTGTKLSDSTASSFTFNDVYWNDQRIVFSGDGVTAAYTVDRDSNIDYSIAGLVKIYFYNGNSSNPKFPFGYGGSSLPAAYTVMPDWDINFTMSDLIFAIVQVDYNKDKGVTGIPDLKFHVTNSMTLPGDCLLDYMTNTRYGAGISLSEIYAQ